MTLRAPRLIYTRDGSVHALSDDQAEWLERVLDMGQRRNNLAYGWRTTPQGTSGPPIPVPDEQRTLRIIRQLHGLGYGERKITTQLNKLGLRPRKSGRPWYRSTVRGILKRIDAGRARRT